MSALPWNEAFVGTGDALPEQPELSAQKLHTPQPDMDLMHIPMTNIQPSQSNPRGLFEQSALESLAESIRTHGVLEPVVVRLHIRSAASGGSGYQLIAGERRFRAAQIAGLDTIPAIVKDVKSDADALMMTLIENLQREQLNPMEQARGYQQLTEMGYSQERIVRECGGSVPGVSNHIGLLKLPEEAGIHCCRQTVVFTWQAAEARAGFPCYGEGVPAAASD